MNKEAPPNSLWTTVWGLTARALISVGGLLSGALPAARRMISRLATLSPALAALVMALIATGLFLVVVVLMPAPPPYVFIAAQTESLGYRVVREGLANVPLERAVTSGDIASECDGLRDEQDLLTGIVAPSFGTLVRYQISGETIVLNLASHTGPAGRLLGMDGLECEIGTDLQAVFKLGDDSAVNNRALPIAGPAEVGIEFGEPLIPREGDRREIGMLRSGEIRIFGRTMLPVGNSSLYAVTDAIFPLPAGGRLTSLLDPIAAPPSLIDAWYGTALPKDGILSVSATSETGQLHLYRPGRSGDAEHFRSTIFARLFSDPSVAIFSVLFVVLTVLIQSVTALLGLRGRATR